MKSSAGPWNQVAIMYPSSCQTVRNRSQSPASRQTTQFSTSSRIASLSASALTCRPAVARSPDSDIARLGVPLTGRVSHGPRAPLAMYSAMRPHPSGPPSEVRTTPRADAYEEKSEVLPRGPTQIVLPRPPPPPDPPLDPQTCHLRAQSAVDRVYS